jgi:membrane protein YdbS with pleckstrin-like domain
MAPQLRIVGEEPEPLASARADARLRLWGAGLCACCAIAMTAVGYRRALLPVFAGPLAAAFLLWALYLLATFVARRAVRYRVTAQRLEIERGLFGKRYESIDLFRVRDVVLDQTVLERVRGVGRITVVSTDALEPMLTVGPVPSARRLYDQLRDAVAHARKEARVLPLG